MMYLLARNTVSELQASRHGLGRTGRDGPMRDSRGQGLVGLREEGLIDAWAMKSSRKGCVGIRAVENKQARTAYFWG